ncbi:hypothetical protein PtA15_4A51 [Puccinia triticina]|uniref:No apical meristem-associated C-terminal domain-containing protein n=1 Tax=Puccinia triticina TaxID=208348 RepID=A0ABY7CEI6_9BASI|nr:uncharacterized protein PtA15_4A51 [Puccinia triticina]WAQ83603.1 hypothetical protein PtA15_4A51 [Puccinia triticina]WAR54439.1 hypothetical protein PtB15_4B56 [Puccinia triticina]
MAPNNSQGIDHNEPSEELELPPLPQPLSPANTTENLSPNATFSSWVNAPKDSPSSAANEFLALTAPQTGPHRQLGRSVTGITVNSMNTFYAMQLRDTNKTIESLHNKNNRLCMGDQAKSNELKEKMTKLRQD